MRYYDHGVKAKGPGGQELAFRLVATVATSNVEYLIVATDPPQVDDDLPFEPRWDLGLYKKADSGTFVFTQEEDDKKAAMTSCGADFVRAGVETSGLLRGLKDSPHWLRLRDLDVVGKAMVALVTNPEEDGHLTHSCNTLDVYRVQLRPLGVKELLPLSDDEIEDGPSQHFANKYLFGGENFPRRPIRLAAQRRLREHLPEALERDTLECKATLTLPASESARFVGQMCEMTSSGRVGEFAVSAMVKQGKRYFARVELVWRNKVDEELESIPMYFEVKPNGVLSRFAPLTVKSRATVVPLFEKPKSTKKRDTKKKTPSSRT